jgi:superfamily II DNA or RNA helicase
MILDNNNANPKVADWIKDNVESGNMKIVTGYFTIGALAKLAQYTNTIINNYQFIIGDIVSNADKKIKALDLLNQNLSIDNALKLKQLAEEAVAFLKLDKVDAKTLEPNFCHAKLYLTESDQNKPKDSYFIMGSSNLTEAGIGLTNNQNVELNIAGTGTEASYRELLEWFNSLWNKKEAHLIKTITDDNGLEHKINFKEYLILEISKLFKEYTPLHIYEKVLFELFQAPEKDDNFNRDYGKLENSKIFNELFSFQKLGAFNLIKMLNAYNGAILADAVGLGKTWTTLAVIKFYQYKGFDTIVLAPKRLSHNWSQYLRRKNSLFEDDNFDYQVMYHTDFTEVKLENDQLNLDYITNDKPKMIVIDESHNLRNDKSIKYQILVKEILQKCKGEVKVLLLSATPINNGFKDVRNQFSLMCRGFNNGFDETLTVKSLEHTFRKIQKDYNEWMESPDSSLATFYNKIKESDFFKLTENLLVARTRKAIKVHFPDSAIDAPKHKATININKTPLKFSDVEDFGELMQKLQLNLSAYQPSQFLFTIDEINKMKKDTKRDVTKDELQRERFLVKMMKILLLKRLESSWKSFLITLEKIYHHHNLQIQRINDYQTTKKEMNIQDVYTLFDEEDEVLDQFIVGKGNPIKLSQIEKAGRLDEFKENIKKDKENLASIIRNVNEFETSYNKNHKVDVKLLELLKLIDAKKHEENKKLIIFTTYSDTALHLFNELVRLGYTKVACVTGSEVKATNSNNTIESTNNFEKILQRFAPYTKLYKEKKWKDFLQDKTKDNFDNWVAYINESNPNTYSLLINPIDILIATDVLSEGQNLQDADMVLNYDIHWNPVRIIQRFGRIDRIGSPNDYIQLVNFWPANDIESYIRLKSRVEDRMNVMNFIGSEIVDEMTPDIEDTTDIGIDERQTNNLLRQMTTSIEELDGEKSIGFDDFSFDNYRQELVGMMVDKSNYLKDLPSGIFSGCLQVNEQIQPGLIALLGVQPKELGVYNAYELLHFDMEGNLISNNLKSVLELLALHKNQERNVALNIDNGNTKSIADLQNILLKWIDKNEANYDIDNDGSKSETIGNDTIKTLSALKQGGKAAKIALQNQSANKQYDLIAWLILSK